MEEGQMKPGVREVRQIEWCRIGDEMDTEVTFELYSTGEARVRITDHEAYNRPEARDVVVLKTDVHELRYVRDNLDRIIGRLEKGDFSDRQDDEVIPRGDIDYSNSHIYDAEKGFPEIYSIGDYTLHIDDRGVVVSIFREAGPSGILASGAEECTKWLEAIREEMTGRARIVWDDDKNRYVVRKRDDP